jgi:hypothetical protein
VTVRIGVDPHKGSHSAVAIDDCEVEHATVRVRATRRRVDQLLAWAAPFGERVWAIESAGGLGDLWCRARRRWRRRHRRAGSGAAPFRPTASGSPSPVAEGRLLL